MYVLSRIIAGLAEAAENAGGVWFDGVNWGVSLNGVHLTQCADVKEWARNAATPN